MWLLLAAAAAFVVRSGVVPCVSALVETQVRADYTGELLTHVELDPQVAAVAFLRVRVRFMRRVS